MILYGRHGEGGRFKMGSTPFGASASIAIGLKDNSKHFFFRAISFSIELLRFYQPVFLYFLIEFRGFWKKAHTHTKMKLLLSSVLFKTKKNIAIIWLYIYIHIYYTILYIHCHIWNLLFGSLFHRVPGLPYLVSLSLLIFIMLMPCYCVCVCVYIRNEDNNEKKLSSHVDL